MYIYQCVKEFDDFKCILLMFWTVNSNIFIELLILIYLLNQLIKIHVLVVQPQLNKLAVPVWYLDLLFFFAVVLFIKGLPLHGNATTET